MPSYAQRTLINALNLVKPSQFIDYTLKIFLLFTVVCVFVPFYPAMPSAGLDSSWGLGMNQAVAQGFSIGKELIFTFGPYASIYTTIYHPSTDFMMIGGGLYLAISYWASIVVLMRGIALHWAVFCYAILVTILVTSSGRDALFFSYPLLVALSSFKIIHAENRASVVSKFDLLILVLLFSPFGLLPLIKGSIGVLCCLITILCFLFFIHNKRKYIAIACLISPLVTMILFWAASGQSLVNLPNYYLNLLPIISGYTDAMAINGFIHEVLLYIAVSLLLLLVIINERKVSGIPKVFLFLTFSICLFLSFKAGFVRHDGHAIIASDSLFQFSVLLLLFAKSERWSVKRVFVIVIISSIFFVGTTITYSKISRISIIKNKLTGNGINVSSLRGVNFYEKAIKIYKVLGVKDIFEILNITTMIELPYSRALQGVKKRIENRNWPEFEFDAALSTIRKSANFPILQGTTDIYSYNQTYLIASGNTWNPRPTFQSYSAYTPALIETNRKHLLGVHAPDNVIFSVEPIDVRMPSLEDGSSWPILLQNYKPSMMKSNFLFLVKNKNPNENREPLLISSKTHLFGEVVKIPNAGKIIFAEIKIKPTFFGRIANIFFKSSELRITLELKNGMQKQYRIIAEMTKSGLIISPLIESTTEFGLLYGNPSYLTDKIVKSFSIAPIGGISSLWRNEYDVTFKVINSPPPVDISQLYIFDGIADLTSYRITKAERCDGNIDVINGFSAIPERLSTSRLLSVNGWLTTSVDNATLPEEVFMVLSDHKGSNMFFKARSTLRPDVGMHFNKPELNKSGYAANFDVSVLDGQYILGLAVKQSEKIEICPQFKIPVTINKVAPNAEN